MINYGTLILVLVGILAMNAYQKKKEIEVSFPGFNDNAIYRCTDIAFPFNPLLV